MLDTCCYSPQEQILIAGAGGKSNPHRNTHKRLFEILETFDGMPPIIDIERARLFTASMKTTEGQPLVLRWAKAIRHIAENITVYVDDRQLIAGRCGTDRGRYGILYPELDGDFMGESMNSLAQRASAPIHADPEDVRIVIEEISPYWQGKTFHEDLIRTLPDDAKHLAYNDEKGHSTRFICSETASYRSSQQWVLDYAKVINRGFASIRAEAKERLDALDALSPTDMLRKKPFLEAVIITCDAIVTWARRHAVLAREKAAREQNPDRVRELLQIAEHCERVPEFPARTFHEAIQAQWFAQAFSRLEQRTGTIISNGRMDQYLYPLFRKDKEEGRLSDEQALELFDCLWLNMAQFTDLSLSAGGAATQEGYAHWEAVTIGGQTPEGAPPTS